MRATILSFLVLCSVVPGANQVSASDSKPSHVHPRLAAYIEDRLKEFEGIPAERVEILKQLVEYIESCRADGKPVQLTFICTHNSRRSQMGQIWGAVSAAYFGIDGVTTYSGGIERTAFNPRAVSALERAGLEIKKQGVLDIDNPHYQVSFGDKENALVCFSKLYGDEPNPNKEFCAVMTCSDADRACPVVAGASERMGLIYEDPKVADGTEEEAERYDERCAQIAREMLFVFSQIE